MPKPRTPTEILEKSGAFKKNPKRAESRVGEPQPREELGPPVENLNELEDACWKQIVKISAPGVLKDSDQAIVEITARLWAKVKTGAALMNEVALLRMCLRELGMTPAARSLVNVKQEENGNEYAEV